MYRRGSQDISIKTLQQNNHNSIMKNICMQCDNSQSSTDYIICLLKKALSDEICSAYQYWASEHNSRGIGKNDVDPQFKQHSYEEWNHVEMLIERIKQLGGFPQENLQKVFKDCQSAAADGVLTHDVCPILDTIILAEKDAIELYKQIIMATKKIDPTTHQIAKKILADEEKHLYDLIILQEDVCK